MLVRRRLFWDLKANAAFISVVSNITLTLMKLAVAGVTGAVSVLSEGIHSGLDLVAALIAFYAVREATKPADEAHQFGHGKFENVSGTVEAILVFVAGVWIIAEAVARAVRSEPVQQPWLGVVVMLVSALTNTVVSRLLERVARRTNSVALQADALHLRTDVYTSAGVVVGLALIHVTGMSIFDSIAAIGVALFILRAAYRLTLEAFMPLLDVSLPTKEQNAIREILDSYKAQYVDVHKLRTRKAGAERHVDLHLVVPTGMSVAGAHELGDRIERDIRNRLPNAQVLIHIEPSVDVASGSGSSQRTD